MFNGTILHRVYVLVNIEQELLRRPDQSTIVMQIIHLSIITNFNSTTTNDGQKEQRFIVERAASPSARASAARGRGPTATATSASPILRRFLSALCSEMIAILTSYDQQCARTPSSTANSDRA